MLTTLPMQLKELFSGCTQYHLKVQPCTHVRVTQGDRWIFASKDEYLQAYDKRKGARTFNRKQQLVRSNEHRKEIAWVAAKGGFKLEEGSFVIVFMKHMPKTWKKGVRKPGKRDLMAWKGMEAKPDIDNYFKKLADSLMKEDKKIWCATIMKIWVPDSVEEGTYFIDVPSIFETIVEFIKEKLG